MPSVMVTRGAVQVKRRARSEVARGQVWIFAASEAERAWIFLRTQKKSEAGAQLIGTPGQLA